MHISDKPYFVLRNSYVYENGNKYASIITNQKKKIFKIFSLFVTIIPNLNQINISSLIIIKKNNLGEIENKMKINQ